MLEQITIPIWLSVKTETRHKLREIFMIPRSASVEVITNEFGIGEVKCDGSTNVDLQAITVEKLINYVGAAAINETIYDLFKRAVAKVEEVPVVIQPTQVITPISDGMIKCEKCAFQTLSKFAMKMHVGKNHNSNKVVAVKKIKKVKK